MRETSYPFSPEVNLLIACARRDLDPTHEEQIRTLVDLGLDWQKVSYLVQVNGVLPLLCWHFNRMNLQDIPAWFSQQLNQKFKENTARNLYLTKELSELVIAFEKNHVPVIAFKGIVLSHSVYGNVSFRSFNDLDLYVRKTDLYQALEIITTRGYQNNIWEDRFRRNACLHYGGECEFVRPSRRDIVDLHWLITPPELQMMEFENQLWERSNTIEFAGCAVRMLSPPDLMMVLCLHGSKPVHGWCRLNWISDIAELSRLLTPSEWQTLLEQVADWHVENMINLGLYLADDLFNINLPTLVKEGISRNPKFSHLSRQIYERMFQGEAKIPGFTENALFYSRMSNTLGESLRYTIKRVFTPTYEDWESISLPLWLYYCYRPFRLAKKHLSSMAK